MTDRYRASATLEAFILRYAPAFVAVADAPSTYHELLQAKQAGGPLPVSNAASDLTIFSSPEVNFAFRAWHDGLHLQCGGDFDSAGERDVAMLADDIATEAKERGELTMDDVRVLWIEVMGQLRHQQVHGDFPNDQAAFTALAMDRGIEYAVSHGPF